MNALVRILRPDCRTALLLALSGPALFGAQAAQATPVGSPPAVVASTAGDLRIETPWMRATPGGATVAGGYVRVTNTGTVADRLVGAAIPIAGSGTVHSMTMVGTVMKMAAVPGGLVVKPGETVDLKPGGFHLMFENLKASPKVGESIAGTLTFERAGTVAVTFAVEPIGATMPGASAPAAPAGHHH